MEQHQAGPVIVEAIEHLLAYALQRGLIQPLDLEYARNSLLDLFGMTEPGGRDEAAGHDLPDSPVPLLEPLLDEAVRLGLLEDDTLTERDLFDARIMGLLMPRPSETHRHYRQLSRDYGIKSATDWFYQLNLDSNYIRMDRIRKNSYWRHAIDCGELEITINLSKPEKDPREIAKLRSMPQAHYPQCLLCRDNVGYAGRLDHPARQNLRIIPLALRGEQWYFQYSPYVYYNEHCIVFKGEHVPMRISPDTFERLLDFVDQFPHYFIGSNADLPIVGGSILNHDHFQGGRHRFPMEAATVGRWDPCALEVQVTAGVVNWPMSVLRLRSADRTALTRVAEQVLSAWRAYSDPDAEVMASSEVNGERVPHNTITPIARFRDGEGYELDLVLRNNRTSKAHPDGIFHPHQELHHIKRENIGLIEVMGLAVLPGRLQAELADIGQVLSGQAAWQPEELVDTNPLFKHRAWIDELIRLHGCALGVEEAAAMLQAAVGDKFDAVLQDAGVFKRDEAGRAAFYKFLSMSGII